MTDIYTGKDADPAAIDGAIAIIGYGSQGRAHALNLRDSGHEVIIGARPGGRAEARAAADGFFPRAVDDATAASRLVALLTPDMSHQAVFSQQIAPHLQPGSAFQAMVRSDGCSPPAVSSWQRCRSAGLPTYRAQEVRF